MSPIKPKSNSSTNKALFLAILSFVVLLALAVTNIKSSQLAVNADTATMIFGFNGGVKQSFSGPVMENMSVLEAAIASTQGAGISVNYYIDAENNVVLSAINKDLNSKNYQWHFYLNGDLIRTEDINKVYVEAGDLIEAKYE